MALIKIWPAGQLTMLTSAIVTSGQALIVTGEETCGPGTATTNKFIGWAGHDAASGAYVTVVGSGPVFDVVSSGAIAVGANVELGAAGAVVSHTEGTNDDRVVGIAIKAAAANVCRVMQRVG
jgi:hypothetical protein